MNGRATKSFVVGTALVGAAALLWKAASQSKKRRGSPSKADSSKQRVIVMCKLLHCLCAALSRICSCTACLASVAADHAPCPDGSFGALAAYLRYAHDDSVDLHFIPHAVYRAAELPASTFTRETLVYLIDYCGPPGFLVRVSPMVKRVVLLDHHKTVRSVGRC
jgi:hypothetical protein